LRVRLGTADALMRSTAMAVFMGIIGRAAVDVSVGVQLLPVIGVPLPLVALRGLALVAHRVAARRVLLVARHEPGAAAPLAWRRGRRRSLSTLARRSGGHP